MKVAKYLGIEEIKIVEEDISAIGPGELLIEVKAAGICGTDLKAYLHGHPYFTPPCVLGHEFSGVVAQAGEEAGFEEGDRVVAAPYLGCGRCRLCLRGLEELCADKSFIEGAFQEYIRLPKRIVKNGTFPIPEGVDFTVASLAEPLACAINGVQRDEVKKGDKVLIIGAGPMGLLLAILAQVEGGDVLVSELGKERLEAAQELGFEVANPREKEFEGRINRWTKGFGADLVIVAVGITQVVEEGFSHLAPGGRMLLFGGLPKGSSLNVDSFLIHYKEITLLGSFGFSADHFKEAVRLIGEESVRFARLSLVSFHLNNWKGRLNPPEVGKL